MHISKTLIENTEKSPIIILEDDNENKGVHLLKTTLHSTIKRRDKVDKVHIVMLEHSDVEILSNIPTVDNRIVLHDLTSDPGGWISTEPKFHFITDVDLFSLVTQDREENENTVVVFDALSQLILHRGPAYTCHVINRLSQLRDKKGASACQVIALLHRDLHSDHVVNLVYYSASSIISIAAPKTSTFMATCRVLHKKLSGKIVKTVEEIKIGSDYSLEECRIVTDTKPLPTSDDPTPDPASNLTFNLTLNESEKRARSEMHLPYMQHMKPRDGSQGVGGEGKIFYQPDDADDFDEEDPDDDLDI